MCGLQHNIKAIFMTNSAWSWSNFSVSIVDALLWRLVANFSQKFHRKGFISGNGVNHVISLHAMKYFAIVWLQSEAVMTLQSAENYGCYVGCTFVTFQTTLIESHSFSVLKRSGFCENIVISKMAHFDGIVRSTLDMCSIRLLCANFANNTTIDSQEEYNYASSLVILYLMPVK